jgi:hypothetical protein
LSSILTFVFNVKYLTTLSSTCLLNGDPVTNAASSDIDVMAVFEGPCLLGAKRPIWGLKKKHGHTGIFDVQLSPSIPQWIN